MDNDTAVILRLYVPVVSGEVVDVGVGVVVVVVLVLPALLVVPLPHPPSPKTSREAPATLSSDSGMRRRNAKHPSTPADNTSIAAPDRVCAGGVATAPLPVMGMVPALEQVEAVLMVKVAVCEAFAATDRVLGLMLRQ